MLYLFSSIVKFNGSWRWRTYDLYMKGKWTTVAEVFVTWSKLRKAFNSSCGRRLKICFPLIWIQINDEFSFWNEKQAEMTLLSHVKDFLEIVRVWWTWGSGMMKSKIVHCMQYFYSANSLQIEFRTAETRNLKSSRDITCYQMVMLPFFSLPVRRLSRYIYTAREKRIETEPLIASPKSVFDHQVACYLPGDRGLISRTFQTDLTFYYVSETRYGDTPHNTRRLRPKGAPFFGFRVGSRGRDSTS